jgi:hypothetical protein
MVLGALLCGAAVLSAGEALVPEVTEIAGTERLFVCFSPKEGEKGFLVRSLGAEERRFACPLPEKGLDRFQIALVAQTTEEGKIDGFSLVTWKPAEKADAAAWPQLKEEAGMTLRLRSVAALMIRQIPEADERWGFEIISFKRIEPKEEKGIEQAAKEIVDESGGRFLEDRRTPLIAPRAPDKGMRYGVLLIPAWKESGKVLDGYDVKLVTTPVPATPGAE